MSSLWFWFENEKSIQYKGDNRKLGIRDYFIFIVLFILSCFKQGVAADPQYYRVKIYSTGNETIDKVLSNTSNLVTLQKTNAVNAFALAGRIKSDYARFKNAMDSFGYYDAKISIKVGTAAALHNQKNVKLNKREQSDDIFKHEKDIIANGIIDGASTDLPNFIDKVPVQQDVIIIVHIQKGSQYRIGQLEFKNLQKNEIIQLSAKQQREFGLKIGDPAVSADIVAARDKLIKGLQEEGHALAKMGEPVAYLHPDNKTLNVVFGMNMGPVVDIGDIDFKGLKKVNAKYIRRRLLLHAGQLYQPSTIENARMDLSSTGVFSSIDMHVADHVDQSGRIPLTITFKEAKRRTVSVEAGYSTDLGGRLGAKWTHHNIFGNAEQLKLAAIATGIAGTAQRGLGYDVYADFTKPDFGHRNQDFNARIEAVKQKLYSYNQTAFLAKVGMTRKFGKRWSMSAYLGGIQEHIIQRGKRNNYTMINLPLGAAYDGTDLVNPMMSPDHGMKASVSITPTESFGDKTIFFAIMQGTASTYFDLTHLGLTKPGRSIFAFRGNIGSIQGASRMNLPPDQRLYAGGNSTVRGFRFQGVGPQFKGSKYAKGGKAMDTGTAEFRQRILGQFGAQAFIDAGQVSSDSMPFEGKVQVGVGGGFRYYTPMGPIRLDIAVPVKRPYRGDRFEVYIGLGETF